MDLDKLKALTKIDYSQGDQLDWLKDMQKIMAAFEKIQAVNTDGIEPLFNPAEEFMNHPALEMGIYQDLENELHDANSKDSGPELTSSEETSRLLGVSPELVGRL